MQSFTILCIILASRDLSFYRHAAREFRALTETFEYDPPCLMEKERSRKAWNYYMKEKGKKMKTKPMASKVGSSTGKSGENGYCLSDYIGSYRQFDH